MQVKKKLFLIDAYALIFRGYYAFIKNPRINSKGMDTSAVLGFMNSLLDLIKRENPENLAVAFDKGGSSDRLEIYQEYKANRNETPDAIKIAVPYIQEILKAMQIPILIKSGYEADDIIGTVAKNAEKNNYEVFMVTPDKDFAQLVSENIFMYRPARMGNGIEIWGVKEVQEKFEITDPLQVIDFLGMMGDSVDNIPGLPGVGEKTAKKFLTEYGSMEKLLENTDKIKGKLKEKIEQNREKGLLSKKLATIMLDVPIDYDFASFKFKNPDISKIKEIFGDLEFRRMTENFMKIFTSKQEKEIEVNDSNDIQYDLFTSPGQPNAELKKETFENSQSKKIYQVIEKELGCELLFNKILNQKFISIDLVNSDLKLKKFGISFTWDSYKSYYIQIDQQTNRIEYLKKLFQKNDITIIGYDLKKILKFLYKLNIKINSVCFDTKIAHYLINPDLGHDFNILCETYLNYRTQFVKNSEIENPKELSMEKSDLNFQLVEFLMNDLKSGKLVDLFKKLEMPLLKVLAEMEFNGIKINLKFLQNLSQNYSEELKSIEKNIFNHSEEEFNLASPKQLGDILFEKLKIIDKPKKTKTGQYSTSEEVLSGLSKNHEIINEVLKWRSLQKLINTYVDALPKQINEDSRRIHTVFNQAVASTGRLSSQNPNLQNIPIKSEKGREIRKAFICENNDFVMLAADYSQIELRVIASLSKDPNMISAFNDNLDIHSSTASKVFNVEIKNVSKEQRSNAKTVNFGIIYGVSAFGLSNQTDLSRSESKDLIESYFKAYPELKNYISNQINFARENGYVETILGRRRYLKDINSRNPIVRGGAERNAVNAPVQGSAADIIKIAMVKISDKIKLNNFKSKMLVQVHDELIFEIYKPELQKMKELIKKEMESVFTLNVPLTVDIGIGENWHEAH
jgi:DNA polymerase-1|tara:strand:+ start:5492 stop:8224 length:2733 start_codon:yes stop_codon:yes gene_type:complete